MRLLSSSFTTSATVPSATRSSSAPRLGTGAVAERAAFAQFDPQRQHQVEHYADAGQILAREAAARLIRVNDAPGIREHGARQMMIGNENAHAQRIRGGDAVDACDAVVYRDQDGRILELFRERDDFGRKPVAVLEAVRHQVIDDRAEFAQRAYADRARRRAVGIVIGDDQQLLLGRNRIGEQSGHALDVAQLREREQRARVRSKLLRRSDAARRENLREQWMKARTAERRGDVGRCDAPGEIQWHRILIPGPHSWPAVAAAARIWPGSRA
jgi:hypothetical protein